MLEIPIGSSSMEQEAYTELYLYHLVPNHIGMLWEPFGTFIHQ